MKSKYGRVGNFEGLYSASCQLRGASCQLRVGFYSYFASCELRVASYELVFHHINSFYYFFSNFRL